MWTRSWLCCNIEAAFSLSPSINQHSKSWGLLSMNSQSIFATVTYLFFQKFQNKKAQSNLIILITKHYDCQNIKIVKNSSGVHALLVNSKHHSKIGGQQSRGIWIMFHIQWIGAVYSSYEWIPLSVRRNMIIIMSY